MRQGSAIHKMLEDEVRVTVEIETKSKEDEWGLRLWNVIQGLRVLRETGTTRELEVWGNIFDGELINGVIDELSYISPDPAMEDRIAQATSKRKVQQVWHPDQQTIAQFFQSKRTQHTPVESNDFTSSDSDKYQNKKVYLCDVKTRMTASVPKGAVTRSTIMQLMLYHRLLSEMADGKFDPKVLFERYNLDADKAFSDVFLAGLRDLSDPHHKDGTLGSSDVAIDGLMDEMPRQDNLRLLWECVVKELRQTLPLGRATIGDVLKVEYRSQSDGGVLGMKVFPFDDTLMRNYLDNEMRWWTGQREAEGVSIEEAYKCRSCEFADECEWREVKVSEAVRNHRERLRTEWK